MGPVTQEMSRHVQDLLDRIDLGELIRRRVVQEAISDALAHTWTRRALTLEAALPRPEDYRGGPVDFESGRPLYEGREPDETRLQDLRAAALACRQKAALLEQRWLDG